MRCGFCGFELDPEAGRGACATCPLAAGGCAMVRCPRCGYENPEESRWLRRLFGGRKRKQEDAARQKNETRAA